MPAPTIPLVGLDPQSGTYDSSDIAADAVSKAFSQTPEREQAAVVYQNASGKYQYSTVNQQATHDNFAMRVGVPQGGKLAAIVHSHPGDDSDAALFSPQDIQIAEQMKVPSYIRFAHDNSIRKYVPGQTKTDFQGSGMNRIKTAAGDPLTLAPAVAAAPADDTPQNSSLLGMNRVDRERPIPTDGGE